MEIHCIRHGRTIHNEQSRFNGWLDEGITPSQVKDLEKIRFQTDEFDVVYCSPLKRCKETALALGIHEWIEEPRLRERNLGIFEGKTPMECEALHSSDFAQFQRLDADFVIPNGESRKENLDRVLSWLDEARMYDSILAITHGGPIDFLYRLATGQELHGGDTVYAGNNAHYSIFTKINERWSIIQWNRQLT